MTLSLALAMLMAPPVAPMPEDSHAAQRAAWNRSQPPFRIAGNVYYVGTAELASYLVADPAGHVLIDVPLAESVPQIAANIETLGFRVRDVRRLLINHAHWDHADGLAAFKRLSGAALWASAADQRTLETGQATDRDDIAPLTPVRVDRLVKDGEVIRLGKTRITAHLTPGHTPGCTSFTMTTRDTAIERGRPLDILMACSLTVAGQKLVGNARYPTAASDLRASLQRLAPMRPDIFLNFHTGGFDMRGKLTKKNAGNAAAFVDRTEWPRRHADTTQAFESELARQQRGIK